MCQKSGNNLTRWSLGSAIKGVTGATILSRSNWKRINSQAHLLTWQLEGCMCTLSCFSHVPVFVTLSTVTHQAPLSMGFSRHKYWSGLPCPPPGNRPNPGIELPSLMSPALAEGSLLLAPPGKPSWEDAGLFSRSLSRAPHQGCFTTWALTSSGVSHPTNNKRASKVEDMVLYHLISEVTPHHFCHFLFIRRDTMYPSLYSVSGDYTRVWTPQWWRMLGIIFEAVW